MASKKIKINIDNAQAINAALLAVNGKATAHTYCNAEDVIELAEKAEAEVIGLVGSKKGAVGAHVVFVSGLRVSNGYNYSREATTIAMERKSTGWFLIDIARENIYPEGGYSKIFLTENQHQLAIGVLLKKYSVFSAK